MECVVYTTKFDNVTLYYFISANSLSLYVRVCYWNKPDTWTTLISQNCVLYTKTFSLHSEPLSRICPVFFLNILDNSSSLNITWDWSFVVVHSDFQCMNIFFPIQFTSTLSPTVYSGYIKWSQLTYNLIMWIVSLS